MLAGPLRLFSMLACLAILASWATFATTQARAGSNASRQGIDGLPAATAAPATPARHGTLRRKLDKANHELVSPFALLTDDSRSAWVRASVPALLGLLVYGFGLCFLARCIPQRR